MTSQPDKLFRDKLENFQQPAPAGAWDRIESNLARPVYKLAWVRVAAGVALLAAAVLVLWPSGKTEIEIAKTSSENPTVKKDKTQQRIPEKTETKKSFQEQVNPARTPNLANSITRPKTDKPLLVLSSIGPEKDSMLITPVPATHVLIATTNPPEAKEETSKKIVYTADEVNSKFLKKKLPPHATPDVQDASGIQKLIGLAYAAKNSEAGLGDLRQKKDDILALNFGKKKGEN